MPEISFPSGIINPQMGDSMRTLLARTADRGRQRIGSLLSLAARTASVNTAEVYNVDCAGLMVFTRITVIGTGTLQCALAVKDYSANWTAITSDTGMGATGLNVYSFYPGTNNVGLPTGGLVGGVWVWSLAVPRNFRLQMVQDSSSWTYSLSYCLIP